MKPGDAEIKKNFPGKFKESQGAGAAEGKSEEGIKFFFVDDPLPNGAESSQGTGERSMDGFVLSGKS